jgi:hypothetical protein
MTFLIEMRSRGMVMEDLLESLEVTAAKSLAPGLTLFRRYLDDVGASGSSRRDRAGRRAGALVFAADAALRHSVLGQDDQLRLSRLGGVSDREGGYRYQATHPFTGNAWPAVLCPS